MKIDFTNKAVQWITLILLALTWGSSFILMKRGLIYFSPTEVAAFRISVAMLVLLPIALRNLSSFKGKVLPLFLAGLFGNAIPAFLFALGQTQISSSLSGMLNSLTSLFTLLIGILFFGMAAMRWQIIGVIVALVGALGVIGFENLTQFSDAGKYSLLIIIAAGCYGIGVNVIKSKLHDVKPTHITSLSFLMVGPPLFIYLLMGTNFLNTLSTNTESWLGVFYLSLLAIVGTAIAVIMFNRLIKETTAVFATTVTYLIPIVALGWGFVDGERVTMTQVSFMALILVGIFLINSSAPGRLVNRLFR
ncbi:MAG: DMT family transporter [Salibacteraceae bacterium]|jgi:drug/metabolite transporter (DMT)-like permease|nr:DMT family transporter [Salibacteraceae bacterium]MDP4687558.1 DMT family transporter [Salibacteraceae bacterium]MDP4762605.1 DMT family transporter [Salibacteraceae bacterium]MDP4844908.1 DMT family transporter [Salibacteraceae bacterium]MDP4934573.1 DMT family transporter [Salibacteraceae bacterium]